nr:transcriptional repressor DicA [Virgibacillus halodenitrificans]
MTFGRRLREAREAAGLNQTELAKRLQVTPQSVQLWESEGEAATTPRSKRITQIASVLQVQEEWLLLGKEYGDTPVVPRWVREVPLLSIEQVPAWVSNESTASPPRVFCPSPCSPAAFALKVGKGQNLPGLLPGDTIFLDPEIKVQEDALSLALTTSDQTPELVTYKSTGVRFILGTVFYLGRDL